MSRNGDRQKKGRRNIVHALGVVDDAATMALSHCLQSGTAMLFVAPDDVRLQSQ